MHLRLGVHHVYINFIVNVREVLWLAKTQPWNVDTLQQQQQDDSNNR